jgi:hypothetical protein
MGSISGENPTNPYGYSFSNSNKTDLAKTEAELKMLQIQKDGYRAEIVKEKNIQLESVRKIAANCEKGQIASENRNAYVEKLNSLEAINKQGQEAILRMKAIAAVKAIAAEKKQKAQDEKPKS